MIHIHPIEDRVLVEVKAVPQGAIITTEKETPTEGIVVAAGPDVTLVETGDHVGWNTGFSGQPIQSDGLSYVQLKEEDISYVKVPA